jgi:uncharacterized protein YndB with AHSA1/START domain
MRRLWTSRAIDAPAGTVWELLVDPARWPAWGPTVRGAELDGALALGARGRVQTALGVWLPFEVTRFEDGRAWSWAVAGVPATDHTVDPLDGGRCRAGFGVPWVAAPYLGVCAVALARIDALAVAGRSRGAG